MKSSEPRDRFPHEFLMEAMRVEQLRMTILAVLLSCVLVSLLSLYSFAEAEYLQIFQSASSIYLLILFIATIVVYELLVRFLVTRQIMAQKRPSTGLQYLNAFLEVSFVTVLLVVVATTVDPFSMTQTDVTILSGPAASAYFIFIVLSTLRLDFRLSAFTGIVAASEYVLVALAFIRQSDVSDTMGVFGTDMYYIGKGIMLVAAGIAAGFVALQIKKRIIGSLEVVRERQEVVDLFGQQVSQPVVDELLRRKTHLSSMKRNVCVLFLDIRNFTPMVEGRTPEEVVAYLNTLFGFVIEIVNRHHGIINQFLGDGVMATFGAPLSHGNDARNAVDAALEIVDRLGRESKLESILPTRVGIGIHVGEAVTGNVGSSLRKQYSITGEVVILASRIEQLTKQYQSQLLLSEEALNASGLQIDTAMALGPVPVKGRERPISLYKLA